MRLRLRSKPEGQGTGMYPVIPLAQSSSQGEPSVAAVISGKKSPMVASRAGPTPRRDQQYAIKEWELDIRVRLEKRTL